MRLLYVEDEQHMAEAVAHILKQNNYSVDLAHNGVEGLDCALTGIYDVIILDIMLPEMDGITILKKLRKKNIVTPVILLTAKGETNEKVAGLDSGADDYLSKPFEADELLARLRALVRRQGELISDGVFRIGDIELNPQSLTLSSRHQSVDLTLKESQLLEFLIIRKGIICSKDVIAEKIWGYDADAEYNQAEVYISFLRKKLSQIKSVVTIQTIRGAGYTLKDEGYVHV
ncbi:response regulator transcription factor [Paenibacillus sp. KQZ6P-2]|uniref:Response regulator transcription factor n=1 Tax=Paenibacillus mangrovi TaxID=2931978 RepID=A0A9X2B588_9BACL|nr:response regulator transcription factor [Paenibacillus mangrovi]MCJ8015316.1 response regulator transcription factor [Paenibacillus mangrovi]